MITGKVHDNEARISLTLRGRRDKEKVVEAVVDTGFTGSLTLPLSFITSLGWQWRKVERATLADGSECLLDVYEGIVVWHRRSVLVLANAADVTPLVGMNLLCGFELTIQGINGGKVTIKRMS